MKNLNFVLVLFLIASLAACQPANDAVHPVAVSSAELETFTDAFFLAQMAQLHIPVSVT